MVALVVRLKLALLVNGYRRSVWQIIGMAFAALYGLMVAGLAVAGMFAVGTQGVDLQRTVTVMVGSVLVIGWWFLPLFAFGVDATLDPERFATFPVPRRRLVVALAVAALVGIPGVLSALVAVSTSAAWWKHPAAMLVAVLGAVLGLTVAVVGGRALVALAAPLVARRRAREVLTGVMVLALISVGPTLSRLTQGTIDEHTFDGAVRLLAWTPFGAPWAAAADAADGDWVAAGARLLIVVVTIVLALVVWERSLARTLVEPPRAAGGGQTSGLGLLGRLPDSPLGAIVARCLVYWVRDPRYAVSLVAVVALPVVLGVVSGGGSLLLVAGPLAAFVVGWGISSDVSYDGSAFWMHVSAGVPGTVDRLARVIASAVVGGPLLVLVTVGCALITGHGDDLPALLGASVGIALAAYAGASIVSALFVQPVQQPGENPFQTRQGASMATIVSQMVGWMCVSVASAPAIVLAVLATVRDSQLLGWAAFVVGAGIGAVCLVVGVRVGGRQLDLRAPVLLQKVVSFE